MDNESLNKIIGIILVIAAFLLPIILIVANQETKVDYSFGFTMGAMFVAGIMMFK